MESQKQEPKVEENRQVPKTLAEQRKICTPGDADSWYSSEDQSQENDIDSQVSEQQKSNSLQKIQSQKKEEEPILSGLNEDEKSEADIQKGSKQEKDKNTKQQKVDKEYLTFTHNVDKKFAILLSYLRKANLVNLTKLAGLSGKGKIHFAVKNGKIFVQAQTKEEGYAGIEKISDFIDDLNLIRLEVKFDLAKKLEKFKKVRNILQQKKIILFGTNNTKGERQIFLGGMMKISQLKKVHADLKNYRILIFFLRDFHNKRSYKIILNYIFQSQMFQQKLLNYNNVNLIEIRKNKAQKCIQCSLNTTSKIDLGPFQYQDFIKKLVSQFFVVTYVLQQNYYNKITLPGVVFRFIRQKKGNVCYLMILCERQVFFKKQKQIQAQLEKIGEFIIGMRFFNFIQPNFRFFSFDDTHIVKKYPVHHTYSMLVSAKTKEGNVFSWKKSFKYVLQTRSKYQEYEVNKKVNDE